MNIYGKTLEDLEKYFIENGEKKFKAVQVYDWIYKKRIDDFSKMTNVNKNTIELLKKDFKIEKIRHVDECYFDGKKQNSKHYFILAKLLK